MRKDYYAILGVLPSADLIVIKAAYKALMQHYHPDKYKGDKLYAEQQAVLLNEAYAVLSDPKKRSQYDAEEKQNPSGYSEQDEDHFSDLDRGSEESWKLAVSHFPFLIEQESLLKRYSLRLAYVFKAFLLEKKNFNEGKEVADSLKKEMIARYFGGDKCLQEFARRLIERGNKPAAKELNKTISVLGRSADCKTVKQKIIADFSLSKIWFYDKDYDDDADLGIPHYYHAVVNGDEIKLTCQYINGSDFVVRNDDDLVSALERIRLEADQRSRDFRAVSNNQETTTAYIVVIVVIVVILALAGALTR